MRENNRLNRPQMAAMIRGAKMTKEQAIKWIYSLIPGSVRTVKVTDPMGFVTNTGQAYEEFVGAMAYNDVFGDWEEYEAEVIVDGQVKINPHTGQKYYEKKLRCIREEVFPLYKRRADYVADVSALKEELKATKQKLEEVKVELVEKSDTKSKIEKLKAVQEKAAPKKKPGRPKGKAKK